MISAPTQSLQNDTHASVSDGRMSFTPNRSLVPDRGSLPLKKRNQKPGTLQEQQQQSDAHMFKVPYPYKNQSEFKIKPPLQPLPRRVPAVYPPWTQTSSSSRFSEHRDWAEFNPPHLGWDLYPPHLSQHTDSSLHLAHLYHSSSLNPPQPVSASEYCCAPLKTSRRFNRLRQSNGRVKAPLHGGVQTGPSSITTCLHPSPHKDLLTMHPTASASWHSFTRVPPDHTNSSLTKDASRSPRQTNASSSACNHFPWLLPHFMAGSLIELRQGELKRVEHLQTEDFLFGSLACPDLCLSSFTVQSISHSASTISSLLIVLHDQQSQELVDVYEEYPFYVRGQGWSSCNPQRTACLCGLHCHQLSVGDVCLVLTPVSPTQPSPSSILKPEPSPPGESYRAGRASNPPHPQFPPGPRRPSRGEKKEAEALRRRHNSAP